MMNLSINATGPPPLADFRATLARRRLPSSSDQMLLLNAGNLVTVLIANPLLVPACIASTSRKEDEQRISGSPEHEELNARIAKYSPTAPAALSRARSTAAKSV